MLLQVENLQTYFKMEDSIVKAVDGVSFELDAGEMIGIVGESGSGKSVTCLSLMKLLPQPPAYFPGGKILFHGKNVLEHVQESASRSSRKSNRYDFSGPHEFSQSFFKN